MTLGEHHEYEQSTLSETDVDTNPIKQLSGWLDVAINDERVDEANAMTVATVDADGVPSARVVLLRGLSDRGLTFYTNYVSRKGWELSENPHIAVVFFWPALQRQVRVEGTVERLTPAESDAYFSERPIKSQMGALVSEQSQVIANRQVLEDGMAAPEQRVDSGEALKRPDWWGGFLIEPHRFEFWQGRRSRLHDRLGYELRNGQWVIDRLAP